MNDPRRLAVVAAAAALAGCRSTPTSEAIEASLRARLPTVVVKPGLVVHAAMEPAAAERYAEIVAAEQAVVAACFASADDAASDRAERAPVRLYLVPTDEPSSNEPWRGAARGGFEGGAFATGFAFLWVDRDLAATGALVRASFAAPSIRHELAHLALRARGLVGDAWFNEGVARHVEHTEDHEGVPRPGLFPESLVRVRDATGPGDLARLRRWSPRNRAPGADAPEASLAFHQLRYDQAEAFVRFLLQRTSGRDFPAQLRGLLAWDEAAIDALEPQWLAWLRDLDALAVIRAGLALPSAPARHRAAWLLPRLAEAGAAELTTAEADGVALAALADPAAFEPAAAFLAYFRARALDDAAIGALERVPAPSRTLLAAALRARRAEPFDLARARTAWRLLDDDARARCAPIAALIPRLHDATQP